MTTTASSSSRKAMRVAVAGAGGTSGALVVARARALSFDVVPIPRGALDAALDDGQVLDVAAAAVDVVVNCVGPSSRSRTRRVVEDAAIAARVPVVHLCAEPAEVRDVFARDADFRRAGIAVVVAAGFSTGVVELATWLALKGLPGPAIVDVAQAVSSTALPSVGSLLSYLADAEGATDDGDALKVMEMPAPIGARAMRRVASPLEAVVLPRAFPAAIAPGGVRAFHAVGPPALAGARGVQPFMRDRAVLERMLAARRAQAKASGERGPTAEERAATQFAVVVDAASSAIGFAAAAAAGDGTRTTLEMTGVDPYGVTAVIALECALGVVAAAGKQHLGALTPVGVVDAQATLAALAHEGVRWRRRAPPA